MEIPILTPDMIISELLMKKLTYGKGNPSFADKFLHDDEILDTFSTWDPLFGKDNENILDTLRIKITNFLQKEIFRSKFNYSNQLWL